MTPPAPEGAGRLAGDEKRRVARHSADIVAVCGVRASGLLHGDRARWLYTKARIRVLDLVGSSPPLSGCQGGGRSQAASAIEVVVAVQRTKG